MAWSSSGSISLTNDWQYTDPIASGVFFRLKHTAAPKGGLFVIANAELIDDKLSITDSQVLAVEHNISDVLKLPKPGSFSERRIAIKRLPKQPTLEQEVKRLFLPGYLQPSNQQEIGVVTRSNWSIDIEISDYIEPTVSVDLTPINTKLDAISTKIDNLQSSNSGTTDTSNIISDPNFNDVALLLHMDGTSGSTTFTDVKGKNIALSGNTQISTVQSKFGSSSAYFDGDNDYLSTPIDFSLQLANSSFTLEAWIYPLNLESTKSVLSSTPAASAQGYSLLISGGKLKFESGFGQAAITSTLDVVVNSWQHVAICKEGNTYYFAVNGMVQEINNTTAWTDGSTLFIGANARTDAFQYYFNGYIDEVRITKNIARYKTNFTPSLIPFPNK